MKYVISKRVGSTTRRESEDKDFYQLVPYAEYTKIRHVRDRKTNSEHRPWNWIALTTFIYAGNDAMTEYGKR
jgi:hypothetical protein